MKKRIVVLAGGVGGAKLALGFYLMHDIELTVIVNTGDDFRHLGLWISPDIDTVTYTLSGIASKEHGWGIENDSRETLNNLKKLGLDTWFNIGDKDLAISLFRTIKLSQGWNLSQITHHICECLGVKQPILPMSNDIVSTYVNTSKGKIPFQTYFVQLSCSPLVKGFTFQGIDNAKPTVQVIQAIKNSDLVVIAPSNPWVSIAPILNLQGIREAIESKMVIAVSPLINNKTVKGPAAKMFIEMGIEPCNLEIAKFYKSEIDAIFIDIQDRKDKHSIKTLGIKCVATNIMMRDDEDKKRLAAEILDFAGKPY